MHSGRQENLIYSLSRWTDVPGAKWSWFRARLAAGFMEGVDPRSGIPGPWSLAPSDTLGLVFWTKDPSNLIKDAALLAPYQLRIHVTVTGWEEVELGAPTLEEGTSLLVRAAETFGAERILWRFSPIPLLDSQEGRHDEMLARFENIAQAAGQAGIRTVFTSFLQPNDQIPETRTFTQKRHILLALEDVAVMYNIQVRHCAEEAIFAVLRGVCEDASWLQNPPEQKPLAERCGCALAVDPFTVNESCVFGCTFCYAADKSWRTRKRDTTKVRLPTLK